MRSEERHKLKTNELADSLVELRDWVKNNASQVLGGIMIVAALIIAVQWWRNTRVQGVQRHAVDLQQQMMNVEKLQWSAVAGAQDPGEEENSSLTQTGYDIQPELSALAQLAKKGDKAGIGATALLTQADALRSKLLYSTEPLDEAAREDILKQAGALYEQTLAQAPATASAVGRGHLGLALIAEERGDMEAAKKHYETIVSLKDGLLAGTTWPARARQRIELLDDIAGELITFPQAPEPAPAEVTAEQTTPAQPAPEAAQPADPAQPAPAPAPAQPAPAPAQPAPADAQG